MHFGLKRLYEVSPDHNAIIDALWPSVFCDDAFAFCPASLFEREGRLCSMIGANASGNLVEGNLVGTDASGTTAVPNGHFGVVVRDAPDNTVGGLTPNAGNVLSGNVLDGVAILNRLKLEGASTKADVILGIDTNLTTEARKTGLLAPHGADLSGIELPIAWDDDMFVPYDFAHFAVVYDKELLTETIEELPEVSFPTQDTSRYKQSGPQSGLIVIKAR